MEEGAACSRNVLVVDDDRDVREIVCAILADEDYTAVEARNGAEALQLLERGTRPCLILLDLTMPVMDGWTFRREQLRRPELAGIPVAVISAVANRPTQAQPLGEVDFIQKPVRLADLLETVAAHCP